MQRRVFIILAIILVLTAAVAVPRVNAEPLTIMAIVGVVTVLSVSSIDMAVHSDERSNKDMRAQKEVTAPTHAKADADTEAFRAVAPTIETPSVATP